MDINSIGNLNSEYTRLVSRQQEAEKAPQAGMEEQEAQSTRVPSAMPSGQSGGASGAAQSSDEAKAKRDEAALKQAAASAGAAAATVTTTEEDDEDSAYEAIVAKADSGQTLTSSELSQLRAKDPSRYYKALRATEARQTLRAQMEQNPSGASKAMKEAVASVRAQAEAAGGGVNSAHGAIDAETATAMIGALNDEYGAFAKNYDQVMF